jgi:signal transduction histidine kinase
VTRRLIVSYLTITVFILVVLEIPLAVVFSNLARERLETGVMLDAMVLATIYEDALDNGVAYSPQPAQGYARDQGARVVVVDAGGLSILDSDEAANQDFSNRVEIQDALAGMRVADRRASVTLGRDLYYVAVPIASGGRVLGAVRVTFDPDEVDDRVRAYWYQLGAIGAVVLAAVAAVGWIIARSVTRPLRAMQDAAIQAGTGDLSVRIDPSDSPSEIRDLGDRFNAMAARLEDLIGRQRTFVSDASHELRTPLTALRLRLENLEPCVIPEAAGELDAAIAESERLAELVDQLLAIARSEAGQQALSTSDLAAVVAERSGLWTAVADEQSASVIPLGMDGPAHVRSVVGAVEQIVDNLIANALAVTPAGGSVMLAVKRGEARHEIHVIDEGPGMSDHDRERAFDRFWRGDHTRKGTGLGLAIVKELAEASGGSAALRPATTGGIDAVVVFPAE